MMPYFQLIGYRMTRIRLALALAILFGSSTLHAVASGYRIETVTEGLDHPWSLAFLPDGQMLITERVGRLRVIDAQGHLLETPIEGVPDSLVATQAGLMDIILDPGFAENGRIYLSQAHGTPDANNTRVVSGRLVEGRLEDVRTVFTASPMKAGFSHFGGRMAFMPDRTLLVTLGDGFDYREDAQNLRNHLGTIVRLNPEGGAPSNNPFVDQADAAPEIYTYGHRNVQGLVYDAQTNRIWSHEHGPRGGDEINLIQGGHNYGWPVVTHGVDYTGARITPYTDLPGYDAPVVDWTPSIAPSGMTLYRGELFPGWQGNLFVSTLAERSVRRVRLEGTDVVEQEVLFTELGERIRDVRTGPDGALYLLTDSEAGRVLRVVPAE